tara:strand:- start:619 stop:981 length:363 start_codon:yes stop_codon:yes gene_type:complete
MVSWTLVKKAWEWCKIHWKFFLGISIPIIVSIILRKGNQAKVYKIAAETKAKELAALESAHLLEQKAKAQAQKEFIDTTSRVLETHKETLKKIEKEERRKKNSITTAEEATLAIKKKLDS